MGFISYPLLSGKLDSENAPRIRHAIRDNAIFDLFAHTCDDAHLSATVRTVLMTLFDDTMAVECRNFQSFPPNEPPRPTISIKFIARNLLPTMEAETLVRGEPSRWKLTRIVTRKWETELSVGLRCSLWNFAGKFTV